MRVDVPSLHNAHFQAVAETVETNKDFFFMTCDTEQSDRRQNTLASQMSFTHTMKKSYHKEDGAFDGTLSFLTHSSLSLQSGGIRSTSHSFIVTTPGVYFIYSQINHKTRITDSLPYSGAYYVYRYNKVYPNDGNELLMRSGDMGPHYTPADSSSTRSSTRSSRFAAGLFYLRSDDEIFINVSLLSPGSHVTDDSYLGLFSVV